MKVVILNSSSDCFMFFCTFENLKPEINLKYDYKSIGAMPNFINNDGFQHKEGYE